MQNENGRKGAERTLDAVLLFVPYQKHYTPPETVHKIGKAAYKGTMQAMHNATNTIKRLYLRL